MVTAIAPPPPLPVMNPLSAPAWAEVYGDDDFGIFAEFTLKAVRFAWRWIPLATGIFSR